MRLTIHDPGHVGLRRGIRAAIAIPLALAIAMYVIDDVTGAIFTVFGSIGLLVNAASRAARGNDWAPTS